MKFIEAADLKKGMRLARPIYNKHGVLLFERDSKLTFQTIESVKNFGLLGVYILEPAEPLPPMSEEDLEFERFQIVTVFSIQDELEKLLETGRQNRIDSIAATILKKYGHMDDKINFYQNLRGRDDFVCRHSLNVAILCTLITHFLNIKVDIQLQTVYAAIAHDIGKLQIPKDVLFSRSDEQGQLQDRIYQEQLSGLEVLENAFYEGTSIKRICTQALLAQQAFDTTGEVDPNIRMSLAAKILLVANRYDEITAMSLQGTSVSEVKAIMEFQAHPEIYDEAVVNALVRCINILFPGVSVELSTGEKALVLTENPDNILRPVVLSFNDNNILDLSLNENKDIQVVDIMKTLDNRYIMDSIPLMQNASQEDGDNNSRVSNPEKEE